MKKKLLILAATLTLAFSWSMVACAQPETMPDGTVFDAEYYAQANPDVKAALGTDANLMYQHYILYGKAEGRAPVAAAQNGISVKEWVSDREVQDLAASMSNSDVKIYIVAVDDKTISFRLQYTTQLPLDEDDKVWIRDMFDELIAQQESAFTEVVDGLILETKINDIVLRIEYINADGSQIYCRDFTKK